MVPRYGINHAVLQNLRCHHAVGLARQCLLAEYIARLHHLKDNFLIVGSAFENLNQTGVEKKKCIGRTALRINRCEATVGGEFRYSLQTDQLIPDHRRERCRL